MGEDIYVAAFKAEKWGEHRAQGQCFQAYLCCAVLPLGIELWKGKLTYSDWRVQV